MANGKKEKSVVKAAETWDAVQCAMEQYAVKSGELATRRAALKTALALVEKEYSGDILTLEKKLADIEAALEAFAAAHKVEFKAAPDGDGRSFDHAGVSVGFRKMPPSVKLPHRKADQEASLEYLRIYRPELVREVPEFNKAAILEALNNGHPNAVQKLEDHGIKLDPGKDDFFVKTQSAE